MKQPQEIEVWYILPAIRREIAKNLMGFGLKQKEVADILKVTEPAVSQYFKLKRAKEVKFNNKVNKAIKNSSKRIYQNPVLLVKEIQNICKLIRKERVLCDISKKIGEAPKDCNICFKPIKKIKNKKSVNKEKNYKECKLCGSFHKHELNNCPKCGYIHK